MKKFILSDLHIGHKDAKYEVMDQMIAYIKQEAKIGDEILGLGDWFHMYENGFDYCLKNSMTKKFRDLAWQIPTKLMLGNHDHILEKYRDNRRLGNPISPIRLISPFLENDIWYCHGHEYDPSVEYIPGPIRWLFNHVPIPHKITPGNFRTDKITEEYMMLVSLVHSRALLKIREKMAKEGQKCDGVVLGHTHLPISQKSPELLFLINAGDMRQSSTFTIQDNAEFRHLTWDFDHNDWRIMQILKP